MTSRMSCRARASSPLALGPGFPAFRGNGREATCTGSICMKWTSGVNASHHRMHTMTRDGAENTTIIQGVINHEGNLIMAG